MIPNIIHFVYFGNPNFDFSFVHYLAVTTVKTVQKPDTIYIHIHNEPVNNFLWECVKPFVTLVLTPPPSEYRGVKLESFQYKADIVRMQKIIEYGGVYMDLDVMTLKNFSHLLNENKCVMGAESGPSDSVNLSEIDSVTNAVIAAEPKDPFMMNWYYQIADNIVGKVWAYHAVCLPKELLEEEEYEYVHLEPKKSFMPFCFRDPWIFDPNQVYREKELDDSYTVHLWETIWKKDYLSKINPDFFKTDCVFTRKFSYCLDLLRDNIDKLKDMPGEKNAALYAMLNA